MFCIKCGNEIKTGANFCANCGEKIGNNSIVENKVQSYIKKGVKIEYIYDGAIIQVVNEGIGMKESLYINGSLIDQHYTGFNAIWGKTLILKVINYPFKSGLKSIQVFCKSGLVSIKFMLCIDNVYVAGDRM